jgi:hypothetical protein
MTISDRRLFEYLEGELGRSERGAVERELAESAAARRRLDGLAATLKQLGQSDDMSGTDLAPAILEAIERSREERADRRAPGARRRRALAIAGSGLAAAAGLVIWLVTTGEPGVPERVRVKAEASRGDPLDEWVGVEVYTVVGDQAPRPLAARLEAGADLLLAYRNQAPEAFDHLAAFAVDGSGEVYWLYPAYQEAGTDPVSIEIGRTDRIAAELPDRIEHALPPGPLAIYAVFTRAPLPVSRIEAIVRGWRASGAWDARRPPRLPVSGSGQHILSTEVVAR